MNPTTSRTPFQSTALAVALASSLFALTACGGGGGGDSSPASGPAGAASGSATVVASHTGGSGTALAGGAVGNGMQQVQGAAGGGSQQGQGTVAGGPGQGAVQGGQQGSAELADDVQLGSGDQSMEELLRIVQQGEQTPFVEGNGPGTQIAHRILAACPTFEASLEGSVSMSDLMACVAGSYSGTDLKTGEQCQVDISSKGRVRAARSSFSTGTFDLDVVAEFHRQDDGARKYASIYVNFETGGKTLPNGKHGAQRAVVYFEPFNYFGMPQVGRTEAQLPEVIRKRAVDYFVVLAANEYDDRSGEEQIVVCGIPR